MNDERWVNFGGSRVRLVCRHLDWGPSVDFVLRAMPQTETGDDAHTTLTLSRSETDGTWHLDEVVSGGSGAGAEAQSVLAADSSLFERTTHLLGRICHGLADQSGPGVLFHAGAVEWGGWRIVIPGGVGRGKSTLTAWLALHGGRYLSDELVYWPSAQEPFAALARPLNLRWAGWQALQRGLTTSRVDGILGQGLHQIGAGILISPQSLFSEINLVSHQRSNDGIEEFASSDANGGHLRMPDSTIHQISGDRTLVRSDANDSGISCSSRVRDPAGRSQDLLWQTRRVTDPARATLSQINLRQPVLGGVLPLLLFPHFKPHSPLALERLSPARTGKALMESLVNGRNLPDHGFGMAVQLATRIPAWQLTYGDFEQLDDAFWTRLRP